jgi:ligand-binding sensor domain-containing protein
MPEKDYSHRDVTDKLGLKPGFVVRAVGKGNKDLLARAREKIGRAVSRSAKTPADVILYWPKSAAEIIGTLVELKTAIVPNGGIWVVTAKRGLPGHINQDSIIPLGLAAGLVDNKICSLSDEESAMRFVIRKSERK